MCSVKLVNSVGASDPDVCMCVYMSVKNRTFWNVADKCFNWRWFCNGCANVLSDFFLDFFNLIHSIYVYKLWICFVLHLFPWPIFASFLSSYAWPDKLTEQDGYREKKDYSPKTLQVLLLKSLTRIFHCVKIPMGYEK